MKKVKFYGMILLCSVSLVGCGPKGSVSDTKLYAPYQIAQVNIVLADDMNSHMRNQVEVLETDEYGRK